jgi:hypothetical protein
MLLRMQEGTRIENPREYVAHAVDHLRHLLTAGGSAERDPHRENFYQLEDDKSTYYIHISPITGNIVLLAKWLRQPQNCYVDAGSLVA